MQYLRMLRLCADMQVDSARHRIGAMAASLGPFGNETQQAFAAFMTSYTLGRGKRPPNGTAGLAVGPSGLEGYAAAFNGSQKLLNAALAKLRSKFAAQ